MNLYTRARKHIDMSRVKSMREEKNQKKLLKEYDKRKELAKLRDKHSPEFSNWRGTVTEGMNTGNVFFTTLPATGETDLESISTEVSSSFEGAGGNDAFENTVVRGSGSGSGSDGGFNIGNHLAFQGDGQPRFAILKPIDSSKFDTLTISAIRGNDTNGGEDPDETGEELRLYYLPPGGSAFRSIGVNPEGQQVQPADYDVIIPLGSDDSGLKDYQIKLPSYARGAAFRYMLYQLTNSGTGFDNYGIKNVRYQRKAPLSLFVPLDSPEAVSFINDGSGGLSPEEKKKRLEDMLAASDEYQSRQFPFNKAAYDKAAQDVSRNIQISLDPETFKFPEYQTPAYNDMFPSYIDSQSSTEQIDRYLEQRGLTVDSLAKDFDKMKGSFTTLGQEGTLLLINNPDTQERALTAMSIDPGLVNNLTPDSYDKIRKITMLRPGGTPATGWDGKFYTYDDPRLEASRVIPLETYLQVKGTDNYAGVERPDRAQPGHRYVMEKPYSFSQDSEARPVYTSVRNKDMEDRSREVQRRMVVSGGDYDLGLNYYYNRYEKGYSGIMGSAKSLHSLRDLMDVVIGRLKYVSDYQPESAYGWYQENAKRNARHEEMLDPKTEYDPLWMFYNREAKAALELAKGLRSGRDLDSPVSYYTNNADSPSRKESAERVHKAKNDNTYNAIQRLLNNFEGITDATVFEQDEWYIDDPNTLEVRTTHPYSQLLTTPSPQDPQDQEKPDDSFMDIQVGDERIIKSGNETVLDTMRGIDNRQKNSIEKELDRIKKMPPNVRGELTRLLSIAGTSEYTPTSPKTKKEIEDYWASLPPEKISEIEGRTQASGVDALGLGLALLAGLALGTPGAAAALTSAIGSGLNKIKNLAKLKPKPKPSNVRYGSGSSKSTSTVDDGLDKLLKNMPISGKAKPTMAQQSKIDAFHRVVGDPKTLTRATDAVSKAPSGFKNDVAIEIVVQGKKIMVKAADILKNKGFQVNSYEPQGDSLMDNYEPKAKHNDKVAKVTGRLKSVSDFLNHPDVKPVFPKDPPPEMINGRHPDLVDGEKVSNRYNRLDPISAKAMPKTGNPNIDAKVAKALKRPK